MREWTEKHIIELIKKYSGGGIVTPPFKEIGLAEELGSGIKKQFIQWI